MPPFEPSTPSSQANSPIVGAVVPTTRAGGATDNRKRRGNRVASATTSVSVRGGGKNNSKKSIINNNNDDDNKQIVWMERHQKQLSRLGEVLAGPSRAIAPIAIIGGTVSVYSSAIQLSNNADFTPVSILYLVLLALNYAVMPRLSKRYIHPKTNKQSVALAEEVVKMSLGMGGWMLSSYVTASQANNNNGDASVPTTATSILAQQLQNWSTTSTIIAAGLPSALYALQGILTYTAYQNLDAVTFNGLTQLKVLSSALCCYLVLGKRQTTVQLCALGLLMMSTVIFQGSWKAWFGIGESKDTVRTPTEQEAKNRNRRLLMGVLPCLSATLLSGLAGAYSQKSLQTQVGMMHRNAYFYTVEISFLSAVCLIISMGMEWCRSPGDNGGGSKGQNTSSRFFQHWTYATLLPITTKATAGLLTALVHRHLGSVIKGFALVLGLVFSALLQFVLEGVDLSIGQLVGTALVLLSSWLHFTNSVQS